MRNGCCRAPSGRVGSGPSQLNSPSSALPPARLPTYQPGLTDPAPHPATQTGTPPPMSGRYSDRYASRPQGPPSYPRTGRGDRDRRDDRDRGWSNAHDPRDSYGKDHGGPSYAPPHRRAHSPPPREHDRERERERGGPPPQSRGYGRARSPQPPNPFANRYDRHQSPPLSFARSYSDRDSLDDRRAGPQGGSHRLDPRAAQHHAQQHQLDPRALSRASSPTRPERRQEASSAYADLDPPRAVPLPRPPSPPPVPLRDEFGRMRQPQAANG